MMNSIGEFLKRLITAIVLIPLFVAAYLHSPLLFSLLLGVVLAIALFSEWPKLIRVRSKILFFLISLFYPILPVAGLILLDYWYRASDFWLPLYPFLVAWTADTFGYVFGKLMGRHKMCPSISPGKTWEGFVGSFLGVFILNFLVFPRIETEPFQAFGKNILILLPLSLAITFIAFLGGFFISFLKRRQDLKDAGALLPGHGGILDRFDSVFFVIFFVWAMMLYPHRSQLTLHNVKQVPTKIMQKLKDVFERGKGIFVKKEAAKEETEEKEEEMVAEPDKKEPPAVKQKEAPEKTVDQMVSQPEKKEAVEEKKKALPLQMPPLPVKQEQTMPMPSESEKSKPVHEPMKVPEDLEKMPGA